MVLGAYSVLFILVGIVGSCLNFLQLSFPMEALYFLWCKRMMDVIQGGLTGFGQELKLITALRGQSELNFRDRCCCTILYLMFPPPSFFTNLWRTASNADPFLFLQVLHEWIYQMHEEMRCSKLQYLSVLRENPPSPGE